MIPGTFVIEEVDIVRLDPSDEAKPQRTGWVNVGLFSINLEIDADGNLQVDVHPQSAEHVRISSQRYLAMNAEALGGREWPHN